MVQMSILEKLGYIFDVLIASRLPFLLLVLLIFFYYLKKVRKTLTKKQVGIIYLIFSVIVIVLYHQELLAILDYIMTNLLTGYYFPDLGLYLFLVIVSHILFFSIYFISRWTKKIRVLLTVQFFFVETDFLLFLYETSKEQLSYSDPLLLYQNPTVLALLEFMTLIFVVLILFFVLFLLLDKETVFQKKEEKVVTREVQVEVPVVETQIVYKEKDQTILKEKLNQIQKDLQDTEEVSMHELQMLKIKQKKELLKIYKKTLLLQLSLGEEGKLEKQISEMQKMLDALEETMDEDYRNFRQNMETQSQTSIERVEQVIENNL